MKPKKVEGYSENVAFMQNLCKIYPTHSYNSVTTDFFVTKLSCLENFPTLMLAIKRSLDLLYLLKYKRTKKCGL